MAVLLGGCQTQPLKITSFDSGVGAPYALRFTQYDIAVTWQVVSCGGLDKNGEVQPFAVKADVAADPKFPDDPSRRWRLDLWSLDGWSNTTDASITYEKGYFKSFNATVEDKSVETASAVLGAAVKIAALSASKAPGYVERAADTGACAGLVKAVKTAAKDVKTKTAILAEARAALLRAQAAQASGRALRAREAAAETAIGELEAATTALADAKKAVTVEAKMTWPKTGSDAPTTSMPLPPEAVGKWHAEHWKEEANGIALAFDIRAIGANGEMATILPAANADMDKQVAAGRIPVRVARPGALVATLTGVTDPEEIFRKESAVIQSGDIVYVPVEYRWPRSTSSGFGIDGDGYLTTVSHKQTAAPGEALGKLAGQFADTAKALHPSALDKLKTENELLDAQKTNAELQKALHPDAKMPTPYDLQLEAINADLAMKKAQLELLKTNAALAAGG